MKKRTPLLIILMCAAAFCAQINTTRINFFEGSQGYIGLHAELWRYTGQSTLEFVLPLYYSLGLPQVTPGLALDVVTSPTYAVQTGVGNDASSVLRVAGSKLRFSYNCKNLFLATAGVQIPTGTNALSMKEVPAAAAISTPQMAFKIADVQSGFNEDFTVATSLDMGDDFVLGGALGYLIKGGFTPVEKAKTFSPGNEFTFTAGADYTMQFPQSKLKLMGEYMFTYYGRDKYDDTAFHQAAPRHTINLRADLKPAHGLRNLAVLSFNLYGTNKAISPEKQIPVGGGGTSTIPEKTFETARTDILLFNDFLYFHPGRTLAPYAVLTSNIFTPSGGATGDAVVFGLGAGGSLYLSRVMTIRAQLVIEGGEMNKNMMLGGELNGGVQYVF
jgi:hypothetical protein